MQQLVNEVGYAAVDTRATTLDRSTTNVVGCEKMQLISVSGVLIDAERHWSLRHSDKLPDRMLVGDIADSSGEWTAFAAERSDGRASYLAFGDYAGYAPIFYSHIPGKALVISDSFSGAVQGLSNLGQSTSLNVGNYLTLLTGGSTTFQTLVSTETMAQEISILGPDEALYVDDRTAAVISRKFLSPVAQRDNYDLALKIAVEQTAATISRMVSNNRDKLPLLTLTGGVDSRLSLAFLSQTSFLRDFRVWTMDPRNYKSASQRKIYTADVEISNQIRRSYKLKWMPARKRQKFSVSLEESIARHQSFNSNFSFKFFPSQHIALEESPILTLRGGGGEILRGTSGARTTERRYKEYLARGGTFDQIPWAAENFLERSLLTEDLQEIALDFLIHQLEKVEIASLRGTLDSFYRAHFGHYRVSESANDHILQVLSNPYIQRVIDLADNDYVHTSGVVRDLFDATEPKLRKFPFESDAANNQLHKPSRRGFRYKDRHGWIADFDLIKNSAHLYGYQFMAELGSRGERIVSDLQKHGVMFLKDGLRIIEEIVPRELRSQLAVQHSRILSRIINKQLPLGRIIAVVSSATDIVKPMRLANSRHFYTDQSSPSKISPNNMLRDVSESYDRLFGS